MGSQRAGWAQREPAAAGAALPGTHSDRLPGRGEETPRSETLSAELDDPGQSPGSVSTRTWAPTRPEIPELRLFRDGIRGMYSKTCLPAHPSALFEFLVPTGSD